jgi:aryl-alcohol dehydrogenase-like predicted oxidoreductase
MAAWEFQTLQNIAEKKGWHQFISMQNYHNLLYREEEREMIPYCQATGVGLIPWSPLARGVLARPWDEKSTRSESDAFLKMLYKTRELEEDKEIVKRTEEMAKKLGVSMAAVATAWSLSKGVIPIIGLSSTKRIDETCENIKVKLSKEDIEYLEEPYLPKKVQGITV